MKKIFLIVAFTATTLLQTSFAQDESAKITEILTQYYAVKDALVNGNGNLAAARAGEFVKIAGSVDHKILPEAIRTSLLRDAAAITQIKDLKKQREYFSAFSDNMAALAKSTKLSSAPVYIAYCPMKKASWLSNSSAIKNPYYGSSMLTCGKVTEILK
ncbi:MAG: DUF3347 domain-containing protein [Pedobacter sp.]|jgi:hypothetical protein